MTEYRHIVKSQVGDKFQIRFQDQDLFFVARHSKSTGLCVIDMTAATKYTIINHKTL